MPDRGQWRRCSVCKNPIALGARYWTCNVSTCNRKRTGLVFCTVTCWDVHLPGANHRESWAEEQTAPLTPESEESAGSEGGGKRGRRRVVRGEGAGSAAPGPAPVLIVASRLKDYVQAKSGGYNTSDRVLGPLSDIVRRVCDEAIANARREGRTTVLERDIPDA